MREYLKSLRTQKGLMQKEVAQKLGISESYYCLIENGDRKKNFDAKLIKKISSFFNVSVEYIVNKEIENEMKDEGVDFSEELALV